MAILLRAATAAVPTLLLTALAAAPASASAPAHVTSTATLPPIPLSRLGVADDRGVQLGGIGSDVFPTGRPGEYWTITDRGPNGQITVGTEKRRTFPTPDFNPTIVKVRATGGVLRVEQTIPLTTRTGKPVTGLPNQLPHDEQPYTYNAATPLAINPNGLDTEGIVRAADGTFWLVDEYGPSLVHVSARGRVLARYTPAGLGLTGTDYPVVEAFPAIYASRKTNRGFEGLGILPGGDLVIGLQSPLLVPNKAAGEASLTTRLLRFSPRKGKVTAEYAYRFAPVSVVDPGQTNPAELKISSIVGLGPDSVLVEERTDQAARLYVADLRKATNLLGGRYDDPATTPSLEQDASTVKPAPKTLLVDLNTVPGAQKKIEGVAVVNPWTIALINDNDFGMTDGPGAFDAAGRLVDSGIKTTLVTVRLSHPLH
ncbi:esterase-like activity of phytase family protein [Dactylosporangium aurantiacum]|uniref:Esterase-like activity of phytase family protein n=1 Tax=Dactylosporangium aurantiacum TaxID=35754 RepID=A0A9Q9IHS9_9ACTN|nr:esterase-like activity of phytase family protein [Dactylosporangium aurantiacum]MDG6100957.1 esterase-like activity of phytase family protein [Dactylosporangium aurantiacum]UWZ54993.1 esterase-like activity of phytase family protein [Dactylosporangium aurantiacum]